MDLIIPNHVAIIMDGNGRWAKERGKIRLEGHKAGAQSVERVLKYCLEKGIKYLTVYAFSTENWKRPQAEVSGLMTLFGRFLENKKEELKKEGIKLLVTGSKVGISEKLIKEINRTEKYLEDCDKLVFNVAFNYGGRREIVEAVQKILDKNVGARNTNGDNGDIKINEEEFAKYLYRPEIPDPELVIRTSGEFRISNFLLWQMAYSEIYVTDVYWPDFTNEEFDKAILSFNKRDRRYGGLNVK